MKTALLLNDTRIDRHHGCSTVIETIHNQCRANGIEIVASLPAHHDWRSDAATRSVFAEVDLLLINGEGTIHHDRPAGLALLAAGAHARSLNIPAVLLNATWQANSAPAIDALRAFDIVSVRESASQAELAASGVEARRMPDLALFYHPPAASSRDAIRYCDSVIGPVALRLYQRMWGTSAEPLPISLPPTGLIDRLRWMRRWHARKSALLNPLHLPLAIKATMQDYRTQIPDRDEFVRRVAASQLLITGRFHAMILALGAVTPVLALASNTHKIEATLRDAGLASWRMVEGPEAITPELIDRASRWHGEEEASLEAFVNDGREAITRLFRDIGQLAAARG